MSEEREKLRSLAGRLAHLAKQTGTTRANGSPGDETTESKTKQDQSTTSKRDPSQAER